MCINCDECRTRGAGLAGKSITDPCLGWKDSERLIRELAEMV